MLYPCFEEFGDGSVAKDQLGKGGFDPEIPFTLPFYGVRYPNVFVSSNSICWILLGLLTISELRKIFDCKQLCIKAVVGKY